MSGRLIADPVESDRGFSDAEAGLLRLATSLSQALTPSDVAVAIAEEGAVVAAAAFANMAVLDAASKRLRVAHGSALEKDIAARWSEFDVGARTPLSQAIRTGHPVMLASLDQIAEHYPELAADTAAASLSATASLPLMSARGVAIGAVGFGWGDPQSFLGAQTQRLAVVAQLAAQALDRALLYEREREDGRDRERAYTQVIQDAFLPLELPAIEGLELAAAYLPARDAPMGGDWYDAFPVDGGSCLVVGDASGHGMQAAAVMGQLRNSLRAFADEDPSPDRVLARLNRMMCRLDPGETASAIVGWWDAQARTLTMSSAGHPPVLRCRAGEFEFLTPPAGGLLLGIDAEWAYPSRVKVMRPGTTLLFYTDGLIETRGHVLDEDMQEMLTFVEGLPDLSPQVLCDEVLAWRLRAPLREDDICLLAVRLD